ncbi:exosortase C-terminal domain/associated protein EpsI, partial [Halorhodospira neutriphila]|uniref:exosortase C-terminal domain/associated protein EpsI n=1 Tax=Halorhodospira neutriphila TaxID=168379 RepID=UPI0019068B42
QAPAPAGAWRGAARIGLPLAGALALLAAGPLYAGWMNQRELGPVSGLGTGAVVPEGWRPLGEPAAVWEPGYRNERASRNGLAVTDGAPPVGLHLGYYREQFRHGSMIDWANTLAGREREAWHQRPAGRAEVAGLPAGQRMLIDGPGRDLVAWRWYWVGGHLTASKHEVKLREALQRLAGGRDDAALVVVYAEYRGEPGEVEPAMRRYAEAALPAALTRLREIWQE